MKFEEIHPLVAILIGGVIGFLILNPKLWIRGFGQIANGSLRTLLSPLFLLLKYDEYATNKRREILRESGIEFDAEVAAFSSKIDPGDREYTIYFVDLVYTDHGKEVLYRHELLVCTEHMMYANLGGLAGSPKLMTTQDDLESTMQPGKSAILRTDPNRVYFEVEFEKHPHQIEDERIIAEYQRTE